MFSNFDYVSEYIIKFEVSFSVLTLLYEAFINNFCCLLSFSNKALRDTLYLTFFRLTIQNKLWKVFKQIKSNKFLQIICLVFCNG